MKRTTSTKGTNVTKAIAATVEHAAGITTRQNKYMHQKLNFYRKKSNKKENHYAKLEENQ